jgi:fructose/tagatose bisphosphate aldolase
MALQKGNTSEEFKKAIQIGRPPNIVQLFPNSNALIVSGKVIDRAMIEKGKAMTIAANGRNHFVIRGALKAAQRANAAIIIEIAKSEGGASAYCAVNFWNLARQVDAVCNELGITVPVAIHADHYGIKGDKDVETAKTEMPSLFDAGITSIAIDASHLPDDENLLANIALNPLFLIKGLNAHDIFPDWIALNNGTTHGIEASDKGIQVSLTTEIHNALAKYKVSGAQHGTSGNNSERLRNITKKTHTTKANVATALQMITWGVKVNEYGNALLDENGEFVKMADKGITEGLWAEIVEYANKNGLKGGNYKKLNLPFENKMHGMPRDVRERMSKGVEDFVYELLVDVFNARDTAPLAIEAILKADSYDLVPKGARVEDPARWTESLIHERASKLNVEKGAAGDFDD